LEQVRPYCQHHDPARAEEQRRAASRAGKSKPSRELLGIKAQLEKPLSRQWRKYTRVTTIAVLVWSG
jgi:hypothetical protein